LWCCRAHAPSLLIVGYCRDYNRNSADRLAGSSLSGLGVHEKGNDESVKTQNFGENENQDHSDEQPGLLGSSAHTSITDDSNGETSSHTGKTDGETSTELDEVGEERGVLLQAVGDQDGHDETVDTNNTSHDDRDNVCARLAFFSSDISRPLSSFLALSWRRTLDDQVRAEDTHGGNTNTGLGSAVGGTEARKDDGGCAAHRAEEGLCGSACGSHYVDEASRWRGVGRSSR
jgi:hypothetical protein